MKSLVIYDLTGKIWLIAHGEETAPQGLLCMYVDIPDGAILTKIDTTNIGNPQPVFEYLPDTDIGRLQKQIKELITKNKELETQLTNTQLALVEVYETLTQGGNA